jgi:hypothetical protein
MQTGTLEIAHIDSVIPYWRNPRRLNQDAVEAVEQSLRKYGYVQPIVVDKDMTIIIGHTRYAALRRLRVDQVQVLKLTHLTTAQVKQLRIIDNKAGEYAFWDFDKLLEEIQLSDSELINALFPDVLEADQFEAGSSATAIVDEAFSTEWDAQDTSVEFVCPNCFHEWIQEVTRDMVMARSIRGGS